MDYRESFYGVNDIQLHVIEAGDVGAPVILFLHGFPEFWYGWHKQIDYFAAQGYHVVVPDQRGYNLSSKPTGVREYTVEKIVADTAALITTLTQQKIMLVGHDWGGVIAWATATKHPELVQKLVILNMPHPIVMAQHLRSDPKQMIRSLYIGFFQLPEVPELLLKSNDFKYLQGSMAGTAKRGAFSNTDMERYREAWRKPGALTTMLNWYRAFRYSSFRYTPLSLPTLIIWGKKDKFLRYQMADDSLKRCKDGQLIFLENATHWLHHEQPDVVNQHILAFIRE